jgi:serine/threonine-protein kinase
MRQELGWALNSMEGPFLLIDVTKPHPRLVGEEPTPETVIAVFKDGPVTGSLVDPLGKAPAGTRLDGHLWTTGERIYGRYVRAHLPGGRSVPICVELTDHVGKPGNEKEEGSKPGAPVGGKVSPAWAVTRWR